jgi:putative addiction module component (TIGR02574 family)
MSIDSQQVLNEALALPASERASLIESLLASLDRPDPTIDALWAREAEERLAAYDAGRMRSLEADDVFAEFQKP